jgi:hypothetical protein
VCVCACAQVYTHVFIYKQNPTNCMLDLYIHLISVQLEVWYKCDFLHELEFAFYNILQGLSPVLVRVTLKFVMFLCIIRFYLQKC